MRLRFTPAEPQHHKPTAAERSSLKPSQFALPQKRRYPIPDRATAQQALRDMQNESNATKRIIRDAIRKKFPGLT